MLAFSGEFFRTYPEMIFFNFSVCFVVNEPMHWSGPKQQNVNTWSEIEHCFININKISIAPILNHPTSGPNRLVKWGKALKNWKRRKNLSQSWPSQKMGVNGFIQQWLGHPPKTEVENNRNHLLGTWELENFLDAVQLLRWKCQLQTWHNRYCMIRKDYCLFVYVNFKMI